jgi:elongation factor G
MARKAGGCARAIALVGPNGSGKTSLMEALLFAAGAIDRQGAVEAGTAIGDASPEARARHQSVELNVASFDYMDDHYALIDCPGSVEFQAEADFAVAASDMALVVTDPDPHKAMLLRPLLAELDRMGVPRALFVNKIDQAHGNVGELLDALQPASNLPLVARQLPILNDDKVTGFVDLALERAFVYRPGKQFERIEIPGELAQAETDARFHMLEQLSSYDDALLEQLLGDINPEPELVFGDLVKEMRECLIAPVFFGSALNGSGMGRLLKAFRHEAPDPEAAAARLGAEGASAYVFKTAHAGQAGKLAMARVLAGKLADGAELTLPDGEKARASGLFHLVGQTTRKIASAETGEVVAIGKVESAKAGDLLSADGKARAARRHPAKRPPVYSLAIHPKDRKDDVRLTSSLAKLAEEDPSIEVRHDEETHELLMSGQGEGHLKTAIERLRRRFGVEVSTSRPRTPYKETIRRGVTQHGRHKKQTGGHGQFGDVIVEIGPQDRGSGFQFSEKVTGGVVPRQWIPAVGDGIKDACERGPLGFPVVDVKACLVDGSYHSVDSSELAFRTAGRIAMSEGLKACQPYLLEPIDKVTIYAPNSATSKITSVLSGRRGQILGFDGWDESPGWDRIEGYLPHAERQDLIVELRSLTQGLATYEAEFDHMGEVTGRLADDIINSNARSAA